MITSTKSHGQVDLESLGRNDLLEIRASFSADLIEINGELEDEKLTYKTTGESKGPEWYQRARGARRAVIKRLQRVDVLLATAPQQNRPPSAKGQDVANLFVDFARARLPEDVFQGILDDAVELWKVENA